MSQTGDATVASATPAATSRWLLAPVVAMAAFMEVLDISIANVSLQHIAGSLAASQDQSTWILTSYLVTNAIVLPISGWLSTVIGRKRFYMGAITGFGLSSLACGLAPNLFLLITFRAIQGLTGGGLQPSSQAILADSFPPQQRAMAFAFYGIAVVFAPAIGPTLGGWITDNYSWHWVFLINVPVEHHPAVPGQRHGFGSAASGRRAGPDAAQRHPLRLLGLQPAGPGSGLPADRPRQRPGRRLVRLAHDHLGGDRFRRLARRLRRLRGACGTIRSSISVC